MDETKIEEAKGLLDSLYSIIDENNGLTMHEQGMYEILVWLIEDDEKPEL